MMIKMTQRRSRSRREEGGRGSLSLAGRVGTRAWPVAAAPGWTRPATHWRTSPWRPRPKRETNEVKRRKWSKRTRLETRYSSHAAHLLLILGGVRRHIGGGGGILRGGDSLRGGGRTVGVSTAVTVISWPSIWPERKKTLYNQTEEGAKFTFFLQCDSNKVVSDWCMVMEKGQESPSVYQDLSLRRLTLCVSPTDTASLCPRWYFHILWDNRPSFISSTDTEHGCNTQSVYFQSFMFMFLHIALPPSMCFRAFSASSGVSNST